MPKVPIMSPETTPVQPVSMPTAPVQRPPAEAFGTASAEAQQRQALAVQQSADTIFQRMLEHQQREDEEQVLKLQTQFQTEVQSKLLDSGVDDNGMPKGYLNRQLDQAKGSTSGFDQTAREIKTKYMAMVPSELQKEAMNKILSTHLLSARERVVSHEAAQSQKAFETAFDANLKTTVSNAAGISDPAMLRKYIEASQLASESSWKHVGLGPEATEVAKKGLASEIVKSAITPLIETDPRKAKAIFESSKDQLNPLAAADIETLIDGKMLHEQQASAWNAVKGLHLSTGEVDLALAQKYIDRLNLPQERKDQILSYVHARASIADSELKNHREAISRSFTNQLVLDHSKGVPIEVAYAKAIQAGWDPMSRATLQNEATELYQGKQTSFDTWYSKQPQEIKSAVEWSKQQIENAYPRSNKKLMKEGATTELETQWLGKTPAQIRQITTEKLKDVVTAKHNWWFDSKEIGWKVDAETRLAMDLKMGQLEKDYGAMRVSQAKAALAREGLPTVPENVKQLLDQTLRGKK